MAVHIATNIAVCVCVLARLYPYVICVVKPEQLLVIIVHFASMYCTCAAFIRVCGPSTLYVHVLSWFRAESDYVITVITMRIHIGTMGKTQNHALAACSPLTTVCFVGAVGVLLPLKPRAHPRALVCVCA